MNKLLLVYAAVIFIAGVLTFTWSELKKDKESEPEPETFKWMKVFSVMLIILAAVCLVFGVRTVA
jgi:Na+/H+ antiporter NhaD/arsenite permease-like protein